MVRLRLIPVLLLAAMISCGQTGLPSSSPVPEPATTPTPFLPAGFAGLPTGEAPANQPEPPAMMPAQDTTVADPTESPAVTPAPVDLSVIYQTIDRLREREGVPDLIVSPDLARLAHARALELALTQSLWHVQPSSGMTPGERMAQAGFSGALAEHVVAVSVNAEDAIGTVLQAWLTDASHRRDVLDPQFALTGLGLSDDGKWLYLVQLLAQDGPRP